jgi:hypothetical protein
MRTFIFIKPTCIGEILYLTILTESVCTYVANTMPVFYWNQVSTADARYLSCLRVLQIDRVFVGFKFKVLTV